MTPELQNALLEIVEKIKESGRYKVPQKNEK